MQDNRTAVKTPIILQGTVQLIDELVIVDRKSLGIPDLRKRVVTFETHDGQILFPEIRNRRLQLLDNITIGDLVELSITFQGSEKNDKKYNNIYIHDIKKI